MNIPPFLQITGDICTGLAAIVFLVPLRHLFQDYARRPACAVARTSSMRWRAS
ncbi:MAG: hypothetical protein U1E73_06425 [Planctomycetota bacterium]